MSVTDDLHQTVEQVEAAASHFITGDPAPYKACWSHADDVTIMGGWGAYEKGWEQVGLRLDWAAGRFRGGQTTYEPLTMGMSGDLAYAISIERGEACVAELEEVSPLALRVSPLGIWLFWAMFLFRLSVPTMGKPRDLVQYPGSSLACPTQLFLRAGVTNPDSGLYRLLQSNL